MSLSDRNKQWLADRLIESKKGNTKAAQERFIRETLTRAFREMKENKEKGISQPSLDDFLSTL